MKISSLYISLSLSFDELQRANLTMGVLRYLIIDSFIFIISAIYCNGGLSPNGHNSLFNRTSFPPGFVFGAGSSAYQVEGAADEYGKGPSIWDTFTHTHPEKIRDHSSGNKATDSYHHYKEDVKIMKEMGLDAYRFSISWPRILPRGKLSGGINEEGIQYYNNLINRLLENGIDPYATLFHWDLPQELEDEYGGFLSPQIVKDFSDYAELCFTRFGDRVKNWATLNEPYSYAIGGYVTCEFAPCRCSYWQKLNCNGGDSNIEPYIVAHHQLLAHGAATKIYRKKYQKFQMGKIGITMVARWMIPFSDKPLHRDAAIRAFDFSFGWYINPLTTGDYPDSMKSRVMYKLPMFSNEERNMLKGSYDFLGINYYTTYYVKHAARINSYFTTCLTDSQTSVTAYRNGVPIGPKDAADWIYIYPRGILDLLLYLKKTYNNPTLYITENGIDERNNSTMPLPEALDDPMRIDYYIQHLYYVQRAIKEGVDVKGFFAWALLDNFEWSYGYSIRFGLNYVDYKNDLKRYPKRSAIWFRNFLKQ